MCKLYDFDFIELVEAIKAAYVFTVRAGLTAEARGVPAQFNGQVILLDHHVAVDVGQRNFGGGNHVQVVVLHVVHLALFIRQLAGSKTAVRVDHVGRDEFLVSLNVCLFEEEPNEPSLELGALSTVKREPCSGYFGSQFKIDEMALLGDVPVGLFVVL